MLKRILLAPLLMGALHAVAQMPPPTEMRQFIAGGIQSLKVAPTAVAKVYDAAVSANGVSIPIRVYQPTPGKPAPVLYLVHGGAWVAGDLDTHDNIWRYLANQLQMTVVAVHYRRPPEHPFPAVFNDSYAMLKWIHSHQAELGSNGQFLLIGDSAGGQLVAAITQANAKEAQPIPITSQVLVNPALDITAGSVSYQTYQLFVKWYVSPPNQAATDFRQSPGLAPSLKRLPAAIIIVGEIDEIRKDGESYHARLQEAGVASELYVQPKAGHLAEQWCGGAPMAQPAMNYVVGAVKKMLGKQ